MPGCCLFCKAGSCTARGLYRRGRVVRVAVELKVRCASSRSKQDATGTVGTARRLAFSDARSRPGRRMSRKVSRTVMEAESGLQTTRMQRLHGKKTLRSAFRSSLQFPMDRPCGESSCEAQHKMSCICDSSAWADKSTSGCLHHIHKPCCPCVIARCSPSLQFTTAQCAELVHHSHDLDVDCSQATLDSVSLIEDMPAARHSLWRIV